MTNSQVNPPYEYIYLSLNSLKKTKTNWYHLSVIIMTVSPMSCKFTQGLCILSRSWVWVSLKQRKYHTKYRQAYADGKWRWWGWWGWWRWLITNLARDTGICFQICSCRTSSFSLRISSAFVIFHLNFNIPIVWSHLAAINVHDYKLVASPHSDLWPSYRVWDWSSEDVGLSSTRGRLKSED